MTPGVLAAAVGRVPAASRPSAGRHCRAVGGPALAAVVAALALLVGLSGVTLGAQAAGGFPKATLDLAWSGTIQGCGTATVPSPSLSLSTGNGHGHLNAHAKTCPSSKGGTSTFSSGAGEITVGLTDPMNLSRSATSIALTWDIRATAVTNVTGKAHGCPTQTNFSSYPIYVGAHLSTWVFVNASTTYCAAEATWTIESFPYVFDATTGTYTYAANAPSDSNVSGTYYSAYRDMYNYSNASYTNATYSGSTSDDFGGAATLSVNWSPTWYLNGSFGLGDHLVIVSVLEVTVDAFVAYETHANAVASFDASGSAGHLDLSSIAVR